MKSTRALKPTMTTATKKNAAFYVGEAIRFKKTTAPDISGTQRAYDVFSGISSLEVLERVLHLLDRTGIPYSYYHDFVVRVGTGSMNCTLEIYINKGPQTKTRTPYSTAKAPIVPGMDTFVIALWDSNRFFSPLFRYIVDNYSAEEIATFTYEDSEFGIHCDEDYEMDRAAKFAEECRTLTNGGLTKEEVSILLQQPVEE
jgi:hypothetical protein